MKLQIVAVGKMKDARLRDMADEYVARIGHYLPVEEVEVREGKGQTPPEIMSDEAANLLKPLPSDAIVVAMDERGKEYTSEEFAQWLDDLMVAGTRYVSFLVGGPWGLDREVRKRARHRVALSRMTWTHDMARTLLCEQLYRAMTIVRGEPYHK